MFARVFSSFLFFFASRKRVQRKREIKKRVNCPCNFFRKCLQLRQFIFLGWRNFVDSFAGGLNFGLKDRLGPERVDTEDLAEPSWTTRETGCGRPREQVADAAAFSGDWSPGFRVSHRERSLLCILISFGHSCAFDCILSLGLYGCFVPNGLWGFGLNVFLIFAGKELKSRLRRSRPWWG